MVGRRHRVGGIRIITHLGKVRGLRACMHDAGVLHPMHDEGSSIHVVGVSMHVWRVRFDASWRKHCNAWHSRHYGA